MCLAASGCAVLIASCAAPNKQQHLRDIATEYDRLKALEQKELRDCNGDPQCEAEIRAIFLEARTRLIILRGLIHENAWEDARQRQKENEQWIRDLVPQFPELKDILDLIGNKFSNSEAEGSISFTPTTGSSGGTTDGFGTQGPIAREYNVAGTITIYEIFFPFDISINGSITTIGTLNGSSMSSQVTSGSFLLSTPNGESFAAQIAENMDPVFDSTVQSDSSGAGFMELTLVFDPKDVVGTWGAKLHSMATVTLPVQVLPDGQIEFLMIRGGVGDLLPHEPWPASDYNNDGVLEVVSDTNAFLAGFANQEWLADSNFDEQWTIEDILLWQERFEEDLNH